MSRSYSGVGGRASEGLHVVRALQQRELTGSGCGRRSTSSSQCVVRRSNLNLRFGVDSVIQKHFLQDGHVVMGFTPCVRYMLTYVVRPLGAPHQQAVHLVEDSLFTYTLYFWTFVPHKFAHVHSSVTVFDRNGVSDPNLHITIAFIRNTHAVLHGRSSVPEENPRGYVTVAIVPSVPKQPPPSPAAPTTANLTVSLCYELVPPYPPFSPATSISLSDTDDDNTLSLLVNTGSHLHSITLNSHHNPPQQQRQALFDISDAASFQHNSSWNLAQHVRTLLNSRSPTNNHQLQPTSLPTSSRKRTNRFFRRKEKNNQQQQLPPPKVLSTVYDSIDTVEEKMSFKMYRKRQLADKMYEFSDEENSVPGTTTNNSSNTRSTKVSPPLVASMTTSCSSLVPRCTYYVNRTYVMMTNDDSVSTTTEIEEDEMSLFPVALPVDVFDDSLNGQQQLPMVRNNKSVPPNSLLFKLSQVTLDLEVLSHEVAAVACKLERTLLNYVIDFDATIVDVSKQRINNVEQVVVTTFTSALIQTSKHPKHHHHCGSTTVATAGGGDASGEDSSSSLFGSSAGGDGRFELSFVFEWHPLINTGRVVFRPKLRPVGNSSSSNNGNEPWNPTKDMKLNSTSLSNQQHTFATLDNFFLAHQYASLTSLEDVSGRLTVYQNSHLQGGGGGVGEDSSEASSTLSSPPYMTPQFDEEEESSSSSSSD